MRLSQLRCRIFGHRWIMQFWRRYGVRETKIICARCGEVQP